MPMAFKKGQTVKQVVPVIQGPILSVAIVDDVVQYEVGWTDASGDHSRFFTEEQLEFVQDVANDPPAADAAPQA